MENSITIAHELAKLYMSKLDLAKMKPEEIAKTYSNVLNGIKIALDRQ